MYKNVTWLIKNIKFCVICLRVLNKIILIVAVNSNLKNKTIFQIL